MGACLDGAGYYAPAAGLVKLDPRGQRDGDACSSSSTSCPGGRLLNGVYMHGGDTVFVQPGDLVRCGQLLGTMGMSFSIENGGHFAHLHYGLYPGAFDMRHNYGYKPVSAGWPTGTIPRRSCRRGSSARRRRSTSSTPLSKALVSATPRRTRASTGARTRSDEAARRRRSAKRRVGRCGRDRAGRQGGATPGHPTGGGAGRRRIPEGSLAFLKNLRAACKGMPGAEKIEEQLEEWKDDDDFQLALKGQSKVAAAEKKAVKERNPAKAGRCSRSSSTSTGDTCLEARIREQLER